MDVRSFLGRYPPFDRLPPEELQQVVDATQIEFFPPETVILEQGGEPAKWLYVVRSGAVELIDADTVLDHLGEGEVFGHPSLVSGLGPAFTVRTLEDTICYLVDHDVATKVLGTPSGLAFFSASLGRRVHRAIDGYAPERADPRRVTVGSLIKRPIVACSPTATVREAADMMANSRVSSLLVHGGAGWGIITDRDLRGRVLALGRSPDTVVGEVMSFPARTVSAETPVPEVLMAMLDQGFHHFPVIDGSGEILGVVTDTDLLALERNTPFALKSAIERAKDADGVIEAARRLPEATCALVDASVDPLDVAHSVAVTIDSLSRRLIELAIRRLGDPPAAWAWLALGSEARQEQGLFTDQDNALAYETKGRPDDEVDPYFEHLAERVTDGLESAGIPRCRAGVIAANGDWRRPLPGWLETFRTWMDDPGRSGSAFTAIAFDFRKIAGPLMVDAALEGVIREAPKFPQFLRHLARGAVDLRPPTGFVKDLVVHGKGDHVGTLDVKKGGILPITNIARFYAFRAGIAENRTMHRLREAALMDRLGEETRIGLEEGFRLLWQIRLEHQCTQVRAGVSPDNFVDPKALGPITRQGVKEAFRVIARVQSALAGELGMRIR